MRKFLACSVVVLGVFALAACGGSGGKTSTGGGSENAFCDLVKNKQGEIEGQGSSMSDKDLDGEVALLDEAVSKAPKEIKGDMETIRNVTKDAVKAAKKAGDNESDRQQAYIEVFTNKSDEVTKAADNVSAYTKDKCGIDIGGSDFSASDFSDFSDFGTDLPNFSDYSDYLSDYSDYFSDFSDFNFSDFSDFFSDFSDFSFSDFSDFSNN